MTRAAASSRTTRCARSELQHGGRRVGDVGALGQRGIAPRRCGPDDDRLAGEEPGHVEEVGGLLDHLLAAEGLAPPPRSRRRPVVPPPDHEMRRVRPDPLARFRQPLEGAQVIADGGDEVAAGDRGGDPLRAGGVDRGEGFSTRNGMPRSTRARQMAAEWAGGTATQATSGRASSSIRPSSVKPRAPRDAAAAVALSSDGDTTPTSSVRPSRSSASRWIPPIHPAPMSAMR